MDNAEAYMRLPHDLSGARSKGRFAYELLWGLKKMLSLFKLKKNFVAVFDQACDVEIHFDTHNEFYQIKTDIKSGSYTINKLIKKDRGKQNSVLGNLCLLKYSNSIENRDTKLYVVSSTPLNANGTLYTDQEIVCLNQLDIQSCENIKEMIKSELGVSTLSLEEVFFIRENMNLIKPQLEIKGKLTELFEENLNCDYKDIGILYRVLESEVFKRGRYELKSGSYEDVIKNKGFSYEQLESIINKFKKIDDKYLEEANEYIEKYYNNTFSERIKFKKAWIKARSMLTGNKYFNKLEEEIYEFSKNCLNEYEDISYEKLICLAKEEFYNIKTIEVTDEEFLVVIIILLKKVESKILKEFEVSEDE